MTILRNAWTNVVRLRDRYAVLAVITFFGAALIAASLLTMNSASQLGEMLALPYADCYKAVPIGQAHPDAEKITYLEGWGYSAEMFLRAHRAVEELHITKAYTKKLRVSPFNTKNAPADSESGKFPVFVMPNSAYDGSFRKGERILVSGRHLTPEDAGKSVLLLDERLARANRLSLHDTVEMHGDDGEARYEIVGLFCTVRPQREAVSADDIDANAVIASSVPDESGLKLTQMYDLYVKFAPGTDIAGFLAYMDRFGSTFGPSEAGFQFVSVAAMNDAYNKGVNTLFSISVILLLALILTVLCALTAFVRVLLAARRREMLILRALNASAKRIAAQLVCEMLYVLLPFAALGSAISAALSGRSIEKLLVRFATAVSPENLRNTSSAFLDSVGSISRAASAYIPVRVSVSVCTLVTASLGLLLLGCALAQIALFSREKMMALLTEDKR